MLDAATILGLLGAFSFIAVAIVFGGETAAFVDWPSIMIVLGGTVTVTLISFSIPEMLRAFTVVGKTVFYEPQDIPLLVKTLLEMAQKVRASGLLAIQREVEKVPDTFAQKALTMAIDGHTAEVIERLLKAEIAGQQERHAKSVLVLKKAADIAPAMGLIGTLIGLVQMLGHLDEPSKIGPAMAVALLTTLYGAVLANMILLPLAYKLERNTAEELQLRRVAIITAVSMAKQENPRQLEMMINSLLPPALRVKIFD